MIMFGLPISFSSFSLLIRMASCVAKAGLIINPAKTEINKTDKIVRELSFINFFPHLHGSNSGIEVSLNNCLDEINKNE